MYYGVICIMLVVAVGVGFVTGLWLDKRCDD